jgi:sugar phosphate isomerase/epimerase
VARPITLFTGQWADLPFEEVARLAGEWGYDGLEIACWGDHLDPWRWDDDDYVQGKLDILERNNLKVWTIPTISRAKPCAMTRSTNGTAASSRTSYGAMATPKASADAPPRN